MGNIVEPSLRFVIAGEKLDDMALRVRYSHILKHLIENTESF